MGDRLDLPVLVAGQRVDSAPEYHRVSFEGGHEIVIPRLQLADVAPALETDRDLLKQLCVEEITAYFEEVSKAWLHPANEWRQLALEWGPKVTGYAPDTVEADVTYVGGLMRGYELYDLMQTDLGDPAVLDDWTRYKAIHYRAWPKGLVAHIMVGNVPLAGFFTLIRSLLTKNVTVAKTPSRDPVVTQCLAQCIRDVDPNHPVTKALTALYWEPESEIENAVLDAADVVTVWGRANTIDSIKRRVRCGTDVIEFGPKRSFSLFLDGDHDWDRAGLWLGFDIVNYDQEACFSTQEAFVVGDPKPLAESTAIWLAHYADNVPTLHPTIDSQAHVQRMRLEALAQGWQVIAPDDARWTVVITDGAGEVSEHPLGRFIYIHPVDSVDDVLELVDDNVQSVTVEPFTRVWEVADGLTGAGADRVVPLGRSGRMRAGFIHDGFHPMRRMVRWSSIERGADCEYRSLQRGPEEEERNYREWALGMRTLEERRHVSRRRRWVAEPPRPSAAEVAG